jgi:uncharacterized membrane protein YkvA (DUF1232 family)
MTDANESAPAAKKSATKKSATASTTKKSTATKATATKASPAKKTPATKTTKTTKKAAAKKSPAKKTAAKQTATRTTKQPAAKKTAATAAVRGAATRAGVILAGRAGERAASLGRAVRDPSAKLFARARARAKDLVIDPAALGSLAEQALRSQSGRSGPVGEVVDDFKTLGRLLLAYSRGEYRDIPLDSLLTVVAGLFYVVSPIDLIPDSVPGVGHADEAVAVGFVIRQVHHELTAFREWEAQGSPSPVPAIER